MKSNVLNIYASECELRVSRKSYGVGLEGSTETVFKSELKDVHFALPHQNFNGFIFTTIFIFYGVELTSQQYKELMDRLSTNGEIIDMRFKGEF